jgi:hypothetical protein
MTYTTDIDNRVESLIYCLKKVQEIDNIYEWTVSINAGGIDYGVYFNFDSDEHVLEICNCPNDYADYTDMYLDEIIDAINNENSDEMTDEEE